MIIAVPINIQYNRVVSVLIKRIFIILIVVFSVLLISSEAFAYSAKKLFIEMETTLHDDGDRVDCLPCKRVFFGERYHMNMLVQRIDSCFSGVLYQKKHKFLNKFFEDFKGVRTCSDSTALRSYWKALILLKK